MIRVCLGGARGRMGRLLAALLDQAEDMEQSGALECPGHPELGLRQGAAVLSDRAEIGLAGAEVLLHFGPPAAVLEHGALAAGAGLGLVIGTTGLSDEQLGRLRQLAETVPVVVGSNMSRGVHLLTELVARAAADLGPEYDVEIVEVHHRGKADAPSGTARQLAETVRARRGGRAVVGHSGPRVAGEIGLSAVRGGDVVGEHQVLFLGPGEQLSLVHRATTREHFARGALAAVRFVHRRAPGFYGMADVFAGGG